jgi:hypothetical protein
MLAPPLDVPPDVPPVVPDEVPVVAALPLVKLEAVEPVSVVPFVLATVVVVVTMA